MPTIMPTGHTKPEAAGFALAFDPIDIPQLVARYGVEEDLKPLAAGARIRSGQTKRADLLAIFEWKTKGRGKSRLAENSDEEIADALRIAASATTERAAVAVLCGLHGVGVPVASAILTAIHPDRYTVIDFRALEALGCASGDRSVNFYLEYLEQCRRLAKRHAVSLRDLDRALWQWSKCNGAEAER